MYAEKLKSFFDRWKYTRGLALYSASVDFISNDSTVRRIFQLNKQLSSLSKSGISYNEFLKAKPNPREKKIYVQDKFYWQVEVNFKHSSNFKGWFRLKKTLIFEDESRTSESIINILT
jgi:hypothetical protein